MPYQTPPKKDPAQRAAKVRRRDIRATHYETVRSRLAAGHERRTIAAELGISKNTLDHWAREIALEERPEEAAAPAAPAPEAECSGGYVEQIEHMRDRALQMSREAQEVGNYTAAQRFSKQAIDASLMLDRVRKREGDQQGGLVISPEALADATARVRARITALAERGLLCAECGRALSIAWAKDESGV